MLTLRKDLHVELEAFFWLWRTGTTLTALSLFEIHLSKKMRSLCKTSTMSLIGPQVSSSCRGRSWAWSLTWLIGLLVLKVISVLLRYDVSVFLVLACREKSVTSALCVAATGAGVTDAGDDPCVVQLRGTRFCSLLLAAASTRGILGFLLSAFG